MSTPAYEKYKESGVTWLGKVPEHWEVKRLKWLFRRLKITDRPDAELLSVYRDYGVIPKSSRDDNFNKPSEDLSAYQLVEVGDLVLNKMKTWQGSIAISRYEGIVSPAYFVAKPKTEFHLQFMHYLLRSTKYIGQYLRHSQGIRPNQWDLGFDNFANIEALIPPLAEQRAIASYLDRETARLDTLISRQERLVELSLEKRRTLIGHAVTRGLDETAPRKASGVEWLGDVPAHWETWKLSHACPHIGSGTTPPSNEPEWYDGSTPWMTTGELRENVITETQKHVGEKALAQFSSLKKHPAGSVVMAMYGATIGRLGILGVEATCNQACCVLAGSEILEKEFLFYWLLRFREEIISLSVGGGQPNINQEIIARLKIAFPPLSEQRAIIKYLDAETAKIDTLIEKARRAIELMKEHRSALIASAVTGQMDVRAA